MKTNGIGVSWDGEENFICEVSLPGFCCRATATPGFRDEGTAEGKKNESAHCNNCSGSIIPALEQIMLICVRMWLGKAVRGIMERYSQGCLYKKQQSVCV